MKHLALFTMKGCPHCLNMKKLLKENNITFNSFDVNDNKNKEAYDKFVSLTDNDLLPAMMIIDDEKKTMIPLAPEKDFHSLEEGVKIVKKYL